MPILRLIALLLEYPDPHLWDNREEALAMIARDAPPLLGWATEYVAAPLIDRQSEWCDLFERGSSTSLLLFEHVHGESRDRGQAMVDLLGQYAQAGLELGCRELPDHLPLYLEYLGTRSAQEAREGLDNVAPILALLGGRLKQRGAGLLYRRLTNPRVRATSTTADILILSILLIQCLLGLTTIHFSAQHPDGSEMMKLVGWAQAIVTFQGGASAHLDGVAYIYRIHLALGMTIFLLFPFTRLVHVWSAPVEYFTRKYQVVRARR